MVKVRPAGEVAEYAKLVTERLNIDMADEKHPDGPLIDLADIALLGGLSPAAAAMARQRTRRGIAKVRFPEPAPGIGTRFEHKPMWHAFVILDYYKQNGNWPLGNAARPTLRQPGNRPPVARPEDKMNWTALRGVDNDLAERIRAARLNDGSKRSIEQWRWRLDNAANRVEA
jgi:hypothetical protein